MTWPNLEHWDCLPGCAVTTYNANGYLYGTDSGSNTIVKKILPDTGVTMTSCQNLTAVDATYTSIRRVDTTGLSDSILVTVGRADETYDMLLSTNGGTSFSKVFEFGDGNGAAGAQATRVLILGPVAVMEIDYPEGGGTNDLIFGEYNINAARVNGGESDRVRIMRSTDDGATWTKLVEWNTNGSNQIGHIHNIRQDPHTGYVYIAVGDANDKAAIIRWDGISAWTDNLTMAQLATQTGFKVATGTQRHRTVGFCFSENYVCTFSDMSLEEASYDAADAGIWYWDKALSTGTRALDITAYDTQHVGWYGVEINDILIFCSAAEGTAGNNLTTPHLRYYMSYDGGTVWQAVAYSYGQTDDLAQSHYPRAFFVANNKIYRTGSGALDAGYFGTDIFYLDGTITAELSVLHPVYYVGTWSAAGAEATGRGQSKWFPCSTLSYMLVSNRITGGARIRVAEGTITDNTSVWVQWNGATLPCNDKGIIIEGQGRNKSIVQKTNDGYYIYWDTTRIYDYPIIIKDIYIKNSGATSSSYPMANYNGTPDVILQYAILEGNAAPAFGLVINGSSLTCYGTKLKTTSASTCVLVANLCSVSQKYYNSIIIGGISSVIHRTAASVLWLYNSTLYNFSSEGITIYNTANIIPLVKNSIFYGDGSAIAISDSASLTETDAEIDYNCYYNCTIPATIANAGGSHSTTDDPKLTNVAAEDFTLLGDSPARMLGLLTLYDTIPDMKDYNGRPLTNDLGNIIIPWASMGAHQWFTNSGLSPGLGLSGGNRPPWWNRRRR